MKWFEEVDVAWGDRRGNVTVILFLRKWPFLCLEGRLVTLEIRPSLFFTQRVWGTQTFILHTFPVFFKWRQIVNWDVFNSQLLCMDWIPPILSKYLDRNLMSILIWVRFSIMSHQNETLKTYFGLCGHKTLPIFFAISVVLALFLNSHITCRICIFSSSILGVWDHRLNYDVQSSTSKIRMINEDIL